jgi:hypothetical protein
MNIVKSLKQIITGQSPEPQVEILILENCLAAGEPMQAGETHTLPQSVAENLIASGRAERILTSADEVKAARLRQLIPPPWTAAPLPESWRSLPACFGELWTVAEKFRCARGRAQEIEVLYLRGRGLTDAERHQLESEAGRTAPDGSTRSQILEDWIHERTKAAPIQIFGESHLADLRRIADALDRANRDIRQIAAEHSENFRRLSVICGDAVLEHIARGRRAAKEAARLGFEIFAERLASLELGEPKLRQLFPNTAAHQRFVHDEPSPPSLKLGWADPVTGEGRHYLDGTPGQLADWHRVFAARADELEAIAKQAAAELAKARRVTTGKAA